MSCNGFCLWKVSLYGVSGGWAGVYALGGLLVHYSDIHCTVESEL